MTPEKRNTNPSDLTRLAQQLKIFLAETGIAKGVIGRSPDPIVPRSYRQKEKVEQVMGLSVHLSK